MELIVDMLAVAVVVQEQAVALLRVHPNHVVRVVTDCTVLSLVHQLDMLEVVGRWVVVEQLHMVAVILLLLAHQILVGVEAHMLTVVRVLF
jgi:hypothetical protein